MAQINSYQEANSTTDAYFVGFQANETKKFPASIVVASGANGTFTSQDGKTITVVNGIISSIV